MKGERKAYVFLSGQEQQDLLLGTLFESPLGAVEVYSFAFDESYLKLPLARSFFLDPDLAFFPGRQFFSSNKAIFGFLSDSAPDRWGRQLLRKQEEVLARKENRKPNALSEFDYLLGVNDFSRMGALRFKKEEAGPYLSTETLSEIPPMTSLRELEDVARILEENKPLTDDRLRQLMAPGSSLGGARPKASVKAPDGSLWIAKFPSKNDAYDVAAFEMVAHDLASRCGIRVSPARLDHFSRYGNTFLTKRFDRQGQKRIPFSSALSLLGKKDGEEASYLDLVSFIESKGANPKTDLQELFRRLAFNIAIANTDDHLRNHGFLFQKPGWELSPAYDLNPNPQKSGLTLNIDGIHHDLDFEFAIEVSANFGLEKEEARQIILSIQKTIQQAYYPLTSKYGIEKTLAKEMAAYFSLS